jgi:hypothetical protein
VRTGHATVVDTVGAPLAKRRGNEHVMTIRLACTGARAPLLCATLWWLANIPVAHSTQRKVEQDLEIVVAVRLGGLIGLYQVPQFGILSMGYHTLRCVPLAAVLPLFRGARFPAKG